MKNIFKFKLKKLIIPASLFLIASSGVVNAKEISFRPPLDKSQLQKTSYWQSNTITYEELCGNVSTDSKYLKKSGEANYRRWIGNYIDSQGGETPPDSYSMDLLDTFDLVRLFDPEITCNSAPTKSAKITYKGIPYLNDRGFNKNDGLFYMDAQLDPADEDIEKGVLIEANFSYETNNALPNISKFLNCNAVITNSWSSGFVAEGTLKNNSDLKLLSWSAKLGFGDRQAPDIAGYWNARVNRYNNDIKNALNVTSIGNDSLAAGSTREFGFQGKAANGESLRLTCQVTSAKTESYLYAELLYMNDNGDMISFYKKRLKNNVNESNVTLSKRLPAGIAPAMIALRISVDELASKLFLSEAALSLQDISLFSQTCVWDSQLNTCL